VESKSYELRVGNGNQNINPTELGRVNLGRVNLSTVVMGVGRLVWLLKMMNELMQEAVGIGACRDH
jgi:hypothetical protein